jgi:hypothetical protein
MNHKPYIAVLISLQLALLGPVCGAQQANDLEQISQAKATAYEKQFLVFDGIRLKNKPDLTPYGLKPISVLYHNALWPNQPPGDLPNHARLRVLAKDMWRRGHLVCVDIEHWPLFNQPDEVRQSSIEKLTSVVDTLHTNAPGLRIGFYGVLPQREYWAPVGNDPDRLERWKQHNQRMQVLADHVDVVFPTLYTLYDDREGWVTYAEANLQEARRYGKQVYVFLWPWYHGSNGDLNGQMLPADFWRMQLDTCRKYADGVVIWADPYKEWDPDAAWWEQTKQFIEKQAQPEP